jgi:hypothetical protein
VQGWQASCRGGGRNRVYARISPITTGMALPPRIRAHHHKRLFGQNRVKAVAKPRGGWLRAGVVGCTCCSLRARWRRSHLIDGAAMTSL